MQVKSLRVKSYRSWRIDDNTDAETLGRLQQLEWVARLREEGCSEATAPAVKRSCLVYSGDAFEFSDSITALKEYQVRRYYFIGVGLQVAPIYSGTSKYPPALPGDIYCETPKTRPTLYLLV